MIDKITFWHLIMYGIIGSFSAGLDFLLYSFFVHVFLWNYLFSNCISVIAGIATSFMLNRSVNFKVTDKTGQRFFVFLTVGLCGMLLSNIILYVCVEQFLLGNLLSKLLSIVLVVSIQFLFNKYITFKPTAHG